MAHRLELHRDAADREAFVQEMKLMKQTTTPSHKNVIALIGVVTARDPMKIIMEYANSGSLLDYLQARGEREK